MGIKDPAPDYVGIWKQAIVKNKKDFSLFFVWEKEGFCIDNIGKANISDWEISDEKLSFTKKYGKVCCGNIKEPIKYVGTYFYEDYIGEWGSQRLGGFFVLSTHVPTLMGSSISEMLWQCERKVLIDQITEKRSSFPYLSLKEIEL